MEAKRQQRLVSESHAITNREKLPGIATSEDRVNRRQFRGRCAVRLGSSDRRVLNHEEDGTVAMERTQQPWRRDGGFPGSAVALASFVSWGVYRIPLCVMRLISRRLSEENVNWLQQSGGTPEATLHHFSCQTSEMGPLKSEAQGLDLSVPVAWSSLAGPFVLLTLLSGHPVTLFRDVVKFLHGTDQRHTFQGDTQYSHWCGNRSA
ncbi:hypothetical protein COCSADRAFT_278613 [Bipolaris sorokiniana ND90Pr]|uniref:Uncharacterized protein n=1 Tax=Cochliobolus sativus (strain ND90Pr / ATCC 201652) TaxID=665912 RepID=M2SNL7_COCSN|nr:uncharacterized protein COCSADRAFT_278613 [Bipolaris sorokiniana ND90Pr]EMD58372.1 hypothetical protein COCSADRAFT_278613 [Bipolaris sorokiniana ND90Pr]